MASMGSQTTKTLPSSGGDATASILISKALCVYRCNSGTPRRRLAPRGQRRQPHPGAGRPAGMVASPAVQPGDLLRLRVDLGSSIPHGFAHLDGLENSQPLQVETKPQRVLLDARIAQLRYKFIDYTVGLRKSVTMVSALTNAFKYLFVHRTPPLPFVAFTTVSLCQRVSSPSSFTSPANCSRASRA